MVRETAEAIEKIRKKLLAVQNRQKQYADPRRREVTFNVGDKVFLKVAPMKGIMRFGKKRKLSPRYIGPFEILDKVGDVAYRLALPLSLSNIHNIFHVSMLRRYIPNPSHFLSFKPLELSQAVNY